jgi:hypothetical protein
VASKTLSIGPGERRFPKTGGSGTFPRIIFENPPFILEKRQILLQGSGSLSIWMNAVERQFG